MKKPNGKAEKDAGKKNGNGGNEIGNEIGKNGNIHPREVHKGQRDKPDKHTDAADCRLLASRAYNQDNESRFPNRITTGILFAYYI